jgi:tetratricopeptide (TPR) repeat protein
VTQPASTGPGDTSRVHAQLERILASDGFVNAPRLTRLLRHLVEHSLTRAGDAELREYALGMAVFDRRDDFDPASDTIVRVQARRLRQRLDAYYSGPGRFDSLRIEIPKGQYRARFVERPGRTRRGPRVFAVVAVWAVVPVALVVGFLAVGDAWRAARGPAPTELLSEAHVRAAATRNLADQAWFLGREMDDLDAMEALVEEALALDPDHVRALLQKAWILRMRADRAQIVPARAGYAHARELVARARRLDPDHPTVHVLAGDLFSRLDLDFPRALAAYEHAQSLGVPLNQIAFGKVALLLAAGRAEEALPLAQANARQDPGFAEAKLLTGQVLAALGRFEEARAQMDAALALGRRHALVIEEVLAFHFFGRFGRGADVAYGVRIADAIDAPGLRPWWLDGVIALHAGDDQPLRSVLERGAGSGSLSAAQLAFGYWHLGDYEQHVHWIGRRVDGGVALQTLPFMFRAPEYWRTLDDWAVADASQAPRRAALVEAHRARLAHVVANMAL